MSHIIEFHVEGLAGKAKGFGKKLNRDVNVFFGLNGSGKTSLLKILHSAMSTNASLLANVPFTKAEVVIESLQFKKQFRYTIDRAALEPTHKQKVLFETEPEMFEEDEDELTEPNRRRGRKRFEPRWKIEPALPKGVSGDWQHRYLPTGRLLLNPSMYPSPIEANEDFFDTSFALELERHWNEFFGRVQAEVRGIQEKGIANIFTEMLSAKEAPSKTSEVDLERAYERATAFLRRQKRTSDLPSKRTFKSKFKESAVLQRVVERIDILEEQISRAMDGRTKLQSLIERLFSGNKKLFLGDTSVEVRGRNDVKIGLQSLSSGEKHILRILFEVLGAGQSTLMVDEPEISLHIGWQRELVKAIRELNPNLQLVVATHSPEVMAELDNSRIFQIPD